MDNKTILVELLRDFYPFAKKELGFNKPVKVSLTKDVQNSKDPLGKTAYYDPEAMHVKLFYLDRHPKDVLRSFAHELMHHKQNCDGRLTADIGEGPVDDNENLTKLEEEANQAGFLVRKWEERRKDQLNAYLTKGAAKEEGEYMQENQAIQEKKKKKAKLKKKPNPWAICTAQVGRDDKDKYESCVLSVKEKYGIKKESLQESKLSNNSDFSRSLDDTTEKDTVKDHYSKRAERVFEKLTEKWKTKKESEVKTHD
jgi:hypothetical protein